MAEDSLSVRLLSDSPSSEDAFGPHGRLARAIADMVRSEPGGKSIAVEGTWGSGKSTVVSLLRKELESDKKTAVVVFDAWSHQGDPLRRSFLENAIQSLFLLGGWIGDDRWRGELEKLARRRRITETRNTPMLTRFGKWFVFAIWLVAPGAVLLGKGLEEPDPTAALTWALLGLLFLSAPLLLLALAPSGSQGEAVSLFLNRSLQDVRSETIETPDPTSIEFSATFRRLLDEALSDPARRIVLVVDNLDRVADSDARSMWSTLQTFLQASEHLQPNWLTRLWTVVPFDRASVTRLWGEEEAAQPDGRVTVQKAGRHRTEATRSKGEIRTDGLPPDVSERAESFLDKAFQVRVEVPPPVLSKWREFLNTLLKEAFPGASERECHTVYWSSPRSVDG